jgi:hypothetical protein
MPEPASHDLQPCTPTWRSSSAGEEFANGIQYYGNPLKRANAWSRRQQQTDREAQAASLASEKRARLAQDSRTMTDTAYEIAAGDSIAP